MPAQTRHILATLPGVPDILGAADGRIVARVHDTWLAVIGPDTAGDWPGVRALLPPGEWVCDFESHGDMLVTHLFPAESTPL